MNWFKRLFTETPTPKPPERPPEPLQTSPTIEKAYQMAMDSKTLTVEEWRCSDVRIEAARAVLSTRIVQDMLAAVRNGESHGYPHRGQAFTSEQAALELGRKEGFHEAVILFESLGRKPVRISELPEPDYGAVNQ